MTSEKFYMVHRHDAKKAGLHFDLRLEQDGVLKSWAIPKGMPIHGGRHLAIQTTDHTMEYGKWEGTIKSGYGAGDVKIDTSGKYKTLSQSAKKWKFQVLTGKYIGTWNLVHWKGDKWLISKSKNTRKLVKSFGVDYDYVPRRQCAWCGKDGKFMVYHLPVGPKSFCSERCFTRFSGLDDTPPGYYGYDAEDYWTPCYHCDTKIGEGEIFYGYKGRRGGPTRCEAFCDEECKRDAGYGDTCCWRIAEEQKCDCGEPISGDDSFSAEDYTTFTDEMETFIGRYGQLLDYESEFQSQERGGDGIMKLFVSFRPDNPDFDNWTLDAEGQADKIEIGDKVRSYDFVLDGKTYDEGSYVEGIVIGIDDVPWCGCSQGHYHIRATARYLRGEPQDDYEEMYFPPVNEYDTDVRKITMIGSYESENWGGDPDGALAQALAQARAKSKKPKQPLKIETLDAESNGKIFKREAMLFGIGIASAVVGTFLAEVLLDKYREDPTLILTDDDEMV